MRELLFPMRLWRQDCRTRELLEPGQNSRYSANRIWASRSKEKHLAGGTPAPHHQASEETPAGGNSISDVQPSVTPSLLLTKPNPGQVMEQPQNSAGWACYDA